MAKCWCSSWHWRWLLQIHKTIEQRVRQDCAKSCCVLQKNKPAEQRGVFEESAVSFHPISVPTDDPSLRPDRRKHHHTSPAWSSRLCTESANCRHLHCTFHSSVYSRVGLCDPLRFTSFEMVACWMVQLTNGRPLPRLGLSGDNRGGSSFVSPFPSRPALILNSPLALL